jgi:hypothetical protein
MMLISVLFLLPLTVWIILKCNCDVMTLEEYTNKALELLNNEIGDKANIGPLEDAIREDAKDFYDKGYNYDTLVASVTTGL